MTVKRYRSEKLEDGENEWRHTRITLYPESNEPRYKPIELTERQSEDLKIVALFVAVLD